MGKTDTRREMIRAIVREREVKTQHELVELLADDGVECSQATVSRDIASLGLGKPSGGAYVLPEDLHLRNVLAELVTQVVCAENLLVVKTSPGGAQGVAAALDGARLEDVLGTIAGDDTILIITPTADTAAAVAARIGRFRAKA